MKNVEGSGLLRHATTVAAAGAVFAQQATVFCVHVAEAQLFCVAGAGATVFAEDVAGLLEAGWVVPAALSL